MVNRAKFDACASSSFRGIKIDRRTDRIALYSTDTYVVAYYKMGYKKRPHKIAVLEKFPVFGFLLKIPELNTKWIRFVNRRDLDPTRRSGVCSNILEKRF